jgi:hypothetical protein
MTFFSSLVEIFDQNGVKIADLLVSRSKEINIVEWNYRLVPPKVPKGKSFELLSV